MLQVLLPRAAAAAAVSGYRMGGLPSGVARQSSALARNVSDTFSCADRYRQVKPHSATATSAAASTFFSPAESSCSKGLKGS